MIDRMTGGIQQRISAIASAAFLMTGAATGAADTWIVSPDGSDRNQGTAASPFRTLQQAATIVAPGDTVIARAGVYIDDNRDGFIVNLNRGGTAARPIVFRSETPGAAVLSGEAYRTTFGWNFGDKATYIRVEGFEIKELNKGGLWVNSRCHNITFADNRIHHIGNTCTDDAFGKAAAYVGRNARQISFVGNRIHDIGRLHNGEQGCQNETFYHQNHDHALYLSHTREVRIVNNVFYNNDSGWIISASRGTSDVTIVNNTFSGPNPYREGHILISPFDSHGEDNVNFIIENNIFNKPTQAAIRIGHTPGYTQKNIVIRNNLVFGAGDLLSFKSGGLTSEFRLDANLIGFDPAFVDEDGADFRLQKDSPCIDTGAPENAPPLDILNLPRPGDQGVDIGAYEFSDAGEFRALIGVTADSGYAPLRVRFDGRPTGGVPPFSYAWDFGDGSTASGANPEHVFTVPSQYEARLRITDASGAIAEAVISMRVFAADGKPAILDLRICAPGSVEPESTVVPERWYEVSLNVSGWGEISFADVWLNHESLQNGTQANRGGPFQASVNYVKSLSISTDQVWVRETEGSMQYSNITGRQGLYVDDSRGDYVQDPAAGSAVVRFKLLAVAEPGTWSMNAYLVTKDGSRLGIFKRRFSLISVLPPTDLQAAYSAE